jgi:Fe2+ or Zn2+ uptake regulation protein
MSPDESACSRLRERGLRVTPQRRAIVHALQGSDPHLTAEQILTRVRTVMPDISSATIYATLRELAGIGVLRELDLGLRERRYDVIATAHAHLVCLTCERVEDVPCDYGALSFSHTYGFQIVDHCLVFRGYCPECAPHGERLSVWSATDLKE